MSAPAAGSRPGPATTERRARIAFRGLLATRLLGALADGAMLPFVVLWARHDGGLDGAAAGVLFLAQALGELTGGLAGGALADRLGHRRTLLVATAGMALGYASLAVIHHAVLAVAAFLVAGLFESAFHPTIAALIGDLTDGEQLHHAFGLNRVAANLGRIAGPLLGAAAVTVSLSSVFAVTGILLVAALLAVLTTIPTDRLITAQHGAEEPDTPPTALRVIVADHRLGLLILGGGLLSITFTWWEADGLVLLRRQHPLTTTGYAVLFAMAAAATVLLQLPTSRLARRYATSRLLLAGAGIQGLGLGVLALAGAGYPAMIAAVLAISLGQMLYSPTVSAFLSRAAAPGRRATYQAAISTTEDIGTALGPVTGLALGGVGPAPLIWLLALPAALAAGLASAHATTGQTTAPAPGSRQQPRPPMTATPSAARGAPSIEW